ncbi:hypothetical protein LSAT2_017277 [Lamellibrachia satsuma]|nr:hypothetical protein LSAT2_017277 [Lamellibrachia satsuma]
MTPQADEARKAILAASLSLMSACVQLMKDVKKLSYDRQNITYRQHLHQCTVVISQSSSQLTDTLRQYMSQQKRFHVGHSTSSSTAPRICDNRIPQHGSCDVSLETLSSVSSSANDVHT